MIVHQHLIIRAEVNNPPKKEEQTINWLTDLVSKIGMKIVSGPHSKYVNKPGNMGITGVVIIETSHIAIHVWDEGSPALIQLDVYTCSPLNLDTVFEHIQEFEPVKVEYKYLDREHGLKTIV